jgi:hypothetical protein
MALSKEKEQEILDEARERFEQIAAFEEPNREPQLDDMKFAAGEQWPEDIANQRKAQGRPMLTINRMPQFVSQVTGDIRLNTPSVKVRPVDDKSDPDIAKVFQGLIRHIEQESDAKAAYVQAAENQTRCGVGWFRILTDYCDEMSFDQDIKFKRIQSPFAVFADHNAREIDKSDMGHLFFTEFMPLTEYEKRWPSKSKADFEVRLPERDSNWLSHWRRDKDVRIAEYWVKTQIKKRIAQLSDGQVVDLAELGKAAMAAGRFLELDLAGLKRSAWDVGKLLVESQGLEVRRDRMAEGHKIEVYKLSGVHVLEGPLPYPGKYIPFVPVIGVEINVGDYTRVHGLVRFAKDPQRLYNFWRSAGAEAIGIGSKSPYLATPKMVENHKPQWDNAHTTNKPYLLYNWDDQAGRPVREPPPSPPVALWQESGIAADDMKSTMGIYDSSLGAESAEKSGKAILARERQGDVGTYVYTDNLSHAIRHGGRILVDLIPRIYDSERIVRILNEDDTEETVRLYAPFKKNDGSTAVMDLSVGKYDVKVDTGPSFTTKRAEAADSMLAFVQAAPATAALVADLIAKNMDWPGAEEFAKRLRKALPPGIAEPEEGEEQQQPDQAQQMQQVLGEMQMMKQQIELQKSEAEAKEAEADAVKAEVEAMLAQIQLQMTGEAFENLTSQVVAQVLEALEGRSPMTEPSVMQ